MSVLVGLDCLRRLWVIKNLAGGRILNHHFFAICRPHGKKKCLAAQSLIIPGKIELSSLVQVSCSRVARLGAYRLSHTARFYLASNAFFLPDSCASPIRMATNHHRQSQRSRLRSPESSSVVHPAPDQLACCQTCHRRSQPCSP